MLPLLLVVLLSVGVHMAPVMEGGGCEATTGGSDPIQDELDAILKEALLNNTENLDKIKMAFGETSGDIKVCGLLNYTILCEATECEDVVNCSSRYNSTVRWTSVDPYIPAGAFLYHFAAFGWKVFGFEWGDACDLSAASAPVLSITVPSLELLCDVDGAKYIINSLSSLTEQV